MIGHKYAVMITLGSENAQKLYTRDVTLKRASLASARQSWAADEIHVFARWPRGDESR
ncbi:MAG: hypothetical protein JWO02_1033 [Solirubrobacterales bacterium]|nr:hypothetical protein [Solirubrobacterales bacterium]